MSLLSRSIAFGVTILGTLILSSASAQSVIDPADPIVDYNPDNKPTPPGWMQVGKWVRTPDTNVRKRNTAWYDAGGINRYKAYIFQNLSFRVMFPKTYNPTGNDGDQNGTKHSDERRDEDKQDGLDPARNDDCAESGAGDGSASVTTHESVR